MTDTQHAPAPASHEVPVTPSQVQSPTPIGPQAPERPAGDFKGSEHRPQSRAEARQEAIQKAFQRAEDQGGDKTPDSKPAAKAAPKAPEKPKAEEKPKQAEAKPGQYREQGRFAKQAMPEAQPAGQTAQGEKPKLQPLPEGTPYRDPPQRMADHAKAEWAAAPESIRGEIHRMHKEFGEAYQRYRADSETMNTIRPFHQMAQQHGTTLDRALNNYVTMEQTLRADPLKGLDLIVNNLNLRTQDGRKIGLRDLAMHIVNQTPEQHQIRQAQNQQGALNAQLSQVNQRLAAIDQQQRQMQYEAQLRQTRAGIDEFADKHPRFDELSDLIEQELKLGFDLDTAYRRAEMLRPSTHAAQTRNPSAQTRQSDRSISGSPAAGGGGDSEPRKPGKAVSRRDALQNAFRRAGSF